MEPPVFAGGAAAETETAVAAGQRNPAGGAVTFVYYLEKLVLLANKSAGNIAAVPIPEVCK
jgi:hypothetical protein